MVQTAGPTPPPLSNAPVSLVVSCPALSCLTPLPCTRPPRARLPLTLWVRLPVPTGWAPGPVPDQGPLSATSTLTTLPTLTTPTGPHAAEEQGWVSRSLPADAQPFHAHSRPSARYLLRRTIVLNMEILVTFKVPLLHVVFDMT